MEFGSDGSIQAPDPNVIVHLDDDDVYMAYEALRYVLDFRTMPADEDKMRAALGKFEALLNWRSDHPDAVGKVGKRAP